MNKDFKKQMEDAKKIIEFNNSRVKKMISDNEKKVDDIRQDEGAVKMTRKKFGKKATVITCAVLAGVAFASGRREGFKDGFEKGFEASKIAHGNSGYAQAIGDVIQKFTTK